MLKAPLQDRNIRLSKAEQEWERLLQHFPSPVQSKASRTPSTPLLLVLRLLQSLPGLLACFLVQWGLRLMH